MLSIRGLYQLEIDKFIHKFHKKHLPIIFKDFSRPNCSVHSFSTRFKDNYHRPYFSNSVLQQSIEFKEAKIWNALQIKSNQISLFLTQLQLQQNELKLNTQNAQLKAGKKNLKLVTK